MTKDGMEDPWGSNGPLRFKDPINQFEDSFVTDGRLTDSQQYLDKLERKLEKLKRERGQDKKLLEALSETKRSHLERIVESDSSQVLNDPDFDQPVTSSSLHRLIAPKKQANTISELHELIRYDELNLLFENLEKENKMEGKFWNRKTYCLITGASQGIGRQISVQFAKMVAENSTFLLLARNLDNLNETKKMMEAVNDKIHVFVHSFNFYEPISFELHTIINQSLDMFSKDVEDFDLAMIVHNAGSLGDVSEFTYDMKNIEKLTSYFMLNFFSVCILNAEFVKTFDAEKRQPDLRPLSKAPDICIVNITSLCAVKPYASMGYYCTGKATREMFFSVMAQENKHYLVLNYSPGPVLTDMTDDIIANIRNEEVKQMFINMKNDSTILSAEESIKKLVRVLEARKFKSGDRIDYYDAL